LKIAILFIVLLTLSATTIATVSIASNLSLPILTSQAQIATLDAGFGNVQPNGDPVGGGGEAPG